MREQDSDWDVMVAAGVEHFIPAGEEHHTLSEACECQPLSGITITKAADTIALHRTLAYPR